MVMVLLLLLMLLRRILRSTILLLLSVLRGAILLLLGNARRIVVATLLNANINMLGLAGNGLLVVYLAVMLLLATEILLLDSMSQTSSRTGTFDQTLSAMLFAMSLLGRVGRREHAEGNWDTSVEIHYC